MDDRISVLRVSANITNAHNKIITLEMSPLDALIVVFGKNSTQEVFLQ